MAGGSPDERGAPGDRLRGRHRAVVAGVGLAAGAAGLLPPGLGLDTAELFAFIGAAQAREWDRLLEVYGQDDPDAAQRRFAAHLAKEIDARGALDVLRHGVKDRGVTIRLAYFRPAHTIADDALVQYAQNRLTVTRQLPYSDKTPDRTLDLVLFVNGVPVATAELKNPLTRPTVEDAERQYRADRLDLASARHLRTMSRS